MIYREYTLNISNIRETMTLVWRLTVELVKAGEILLIVTEISKSRAQERKYHVMLSEIAAQVKFQRQDKPGGPLVSKTYSVDVWKAMLVDAFEQERIANGEPLTHGSELVPSIDGQRLVSLRASTTRFKKREASEFIEFLYATGVEYGVKWSATAEEIAAAERNGQMANKGE